ncbi:MAG: ABC transporter permease, partial [Firmicutes bacterium]|nr:ABC transporter permease [Bacillota bacterium]
MLGRMLKKDLSKRIGINLILFLFITLATVFLASSVNNILVVNSSMEYYMDYANVPDVNLIVNSNREKKQIDTWLETQKNEGLISTYDYNQFLILSEKDTKIKKENKVEPINLNGVSLYAGKMDVDFNKVYDEKGNAFVLKKGEIALSNSVMNKNQLKIGDKIIIKVQTQEREFKIKVKMKDAAFGSEMVGMTRFMLSDEDYHQLENKQSLGLYYIMTNNVQELSQKINDQTYSTVMNLVTKDVYK